METRVEFECGNLILEGMLDDQHSDTAVVICHPHPLYGGNMHNHVVMTIASVFRARGVTTLRFNFRGTGSSEGLFDDGEGEQDDVRAALAFLKARGCSNLWLAGYSFGARMNASVVCSGCDIADHIMVSPPCGFMSFDHIDRMPNTGLIVTGSRDDIAPVNLIEDLIRRWKTSIRFEVIEGADHFYSGRLDALEAILLGYLNSRLKE